MSFINNHTVSQHTRKLGASASSRHKIIRVIGLLVEPFVMIKRDCLKSFNNSEGCRGNDRFEGYCVDMFKLLTDPIEDFHYEIFLSADNKYGAKQPDGSWDGLIGYLLRGEADVSMASLTINQVLFLIIQRKLLF